MADDLKERLRSQRVVNAWSRPLGPVDKECVNPDGPEAADRIEALEADLRAALKNGVEWARQAGEAKGRLEASEMAGIVEDWKERAEAAEGKLRVAVEALEGIADYPGLHADEAAHLRVDDARSALRSIRGEG